MRNQRENILETRIHSSRLITRDKNVAEESEKLSGRNVEDKREQQENRLAELPRKRRDSLVGIDLL